MVTRVYVRGVLDVRGGEPHWSPDGIDTIEVPQDASITVSDSGSVMIGMDPIPHESGDSRRTTFGTTKSVPSWRVIEVVTTSE